MNRLKYALSLLATVFSLHACSGCDNSGLDLIFPIGLAVEDLDRDGSADIVYATDEDDSSQPQIATILLNDIAAPGKLNLVQHLPLPGDIPLFSNVVQLGDLNNDGFADITFNDDEVFHLSFQDAGRAGRFLPTVTIATGLFAGNLAIADLDQDGINDIAAAGSGSNLSVLFQDAGDPGKFLPLVDLGITAVWVAAGDIDGDMITDLVVADSAADRVRLLIQNPGLPGTFTAALDLDTGTTPAEIRISDIDRDGLPDLVVVKEARSPDLVNGSIALLRQDGANPGQFLPLANVAPGIRGTRLGIGDLNDDGWPDFAISMSERDLAILFQNAASPGTFEPPVSLRLHKRVGAEQIVVADMNNDTFNDLVVANDGALIRFQNPAAPGTFFDWIQIFDRD